MLAIIKGETESFRCRQALSADDNVLISAGSLTEMLIVAAGKDLLDPMQAMLAALQPTVVPLTEARARAAAGAYGRFGKGFHPAGLNFGDCFAYALAREYDAPLLFVGNDFAQTDVTPALRWVSRRRRTLRSAVLQARGSA